MPNENLPNLTAADWRLLKAIIEGVSNKQLAQALCKSEFTIRNRLSLLYRKIDVSNRTQAAFWYWAQQVRQTQTPARDFQPQSGRPQ